MAEQQPYILARTFAESHKFAREVLGLSHGQYRVITSAGTIKSVRNVKLYLAPGWRRRTDGFTMKSAIRWTHMTVIDWEKQQAEESAGVPDGLEPEGVQLTITDDEAHAFVSNGDTMIYEGGPVQPEEDEAPQVKRRRRRCDDCGTLHFKNESCPSEPLPGV